MLSEYFILEVYRKATLPMAADECLGRRRYEVYPSQSEIIETIKATKSNLANVLKKYEWNEDGQ